MANLKSPHAGTVIRERAHPFAGDAARHRRAIAKEKSDPITCTINDKEVTVQRGTTILEACFDAGVYVPHYCYDTDLTIVASCRLCLVEVEKVPKLIPSCSSPVADGNVIYTDSEKVIDARNWQMELLLANHPLDCPVCDQGGHCQLQRYSMDYGTDDSRFRFPKRVFPKPDLGAFIDLERNRCILCTRCVRFMEEIAGNAELEVMGRGNDSYIGTFQERPLENEFAGNTIDICPVGCLTDKVFRFRARVWELQPKPSLCNLCSVGCNIDVEGRARNHELLRITPRTNDAVNHRWICDKGRFGYDFVNSPERVRIPMVRRDGALQHANGVNPVDLSVERIRTIKENHGGRAIAGIAGAELSNETLYLFQKLLRETLDCPNIDHRTEHVATGTDDGYLASLRLGAVNDPIDEVEGADTILLVGSDLPNELPILNLRLQQRLKGPNPATLLVAANRGGEYEAAANGYIRYKPDTDGAFAFLLLSAVMQVKSADVPGELASSIANINAEECLRECGVEWDVVERLAQILAKAEHLTVLIGEDLWSAPDGANTVTILANAARILGLEHQKRVGLNLLLPHANSRGAIDMGVLPHLGPALKPIADPGLGTTEILNAAIDGDVKGLILLGTDILNRYPDRALAKKALDAAEFVLVVDAFKHETADMADAFLPITTFAEEEGTLTNTSGRVQRRLPILKPLPGTATPTRVLQVLSQRFGGESKEKQPKDIFTDLAGRVSCYDAMTWDGLGELGADADYAKGAAYAERGGCFVPFEPLKSPSPAPDGYPLRIVRGRRLWDQSGVSRYTPALMQRNELAGGVVVQLARAEADTRKIASGAEVTVAGPSGSLRATVSVTDAAPEGCAVLLGSYDAGASNELTSGGATHVRLVT